MPTTVLLVEDEEMLRSLLVEVLALIDVDSVACVNADEALTRLERSHDFDLVISDICMPGSRDGLELAQLIWERWPDLPVILSSGNRVVSDARLAQNASFIRKPWTLDELHRVVIERLSR
ncbi:response regulator [Pseudomonas sp. v388]|uniref:response regulator n=1 Tax=Pseudomonas sp. v388 TaxID=2479849 RepID=UPI000F78D4E9|nr:response regulator [Pseudomonas sp. v388]RRV10564.1 response regulator [Pseudomonas sp. v388]